jgi:hypothetical protein
MYAVTHGSAALQRHLTQAERHVAGRGCVERQKELVTKLHADGHNTESAIRLLDTLMISQGSHEEHLDRLRNSASRTEYSIKDRHPTCWIPNDSEFVLGGRQLAS